MKHTLRGTLLLVMLLVFGVSGAIADPVQEFGVQIKNVTADGRFSVVFTSNSFDTTGAPPPGLTEASVRLAKGITIKPEFLRKDRLCQTGKLRLILLAHASSNVKYQAMLGNLAATQKRIGGKLNRASLRIVDTCRRAFVGRGTFTLDARPNFPDVIPGFMYVFLSPPSAKGAIGGFGIMSLYDQSAPIVRNTGLLTDQQPGPPSTCSTTRAPTGSTGTGCGCSRSTSGVFRSASPRCTSRAGASPRAGSSGPSCRSARLPASSSSRPTTATRPACAPATSSRCPARASGAERRQPATALTASPASFAASTRHRTTMIVAFSRSIHARMPVRIVAPRSRIATWIATGTPRASDPSRTNTASATA